MGILLCYRFKISTRFSQATFVCDTVFGLLCVLKNYVDWKWLRFYHEEMKYDYTYCRHNGECTENIQEIDELVTNN